MPCIRLHLTHMIEKEMKYDEALKNTQELGYAESNSDSAVKGFDTLYKKHAVKIVPVFDGSFTDLFYIRFKLHHKHKIKSIFKILPIMVLRLLNQRMQTMFMLRLLSFMAMM